MLKILGNLSNLGIDNQAILSNPELFRKFLRFIKWSRYFISNESTDLFKVLVLFVKRDYRILYKAMIHYYVYGYHVLF